MRNKPFLTVFTLLALAILVVFASSAQAQAVAEPADQPRTLSINGSGTVTLTPDLARLMIGVHTEAESAAEAVAANNSQAQALLAALQAAGIAEADLQTANFSVYPRQDYGPEGELVGLTYVVDNAVQVTVRELENLGQILDAAVEAGANNIGGVQFDLADREAAYEQALELAVGNARSRAQVLAEAAGVTLGDIQKIETYVGGGGVIMPAPRVFAEVAMDVPVATGEMQISLDVSVIFTLQ